MRLNRRGAPRKTLFEVIGPKHAVFRLSVSVALDEAIEGKVEADGGVESYIGKDTDDHSDDDSDSGENAPVSFALGRGKTDSVRGANEGQIAKQQAGLFRTMHVSIIAGFLVVATGVVGLTVLDNTSARIAVGASLTGLGASMSLYIRTIVVPQHRHHLDALALERSHADERQALRDRLAIISAVIRDHPGQTEAVLKLLSANNQTIRDGERSEARGSAGRHSK